VKEPWGVRTANRVAAKLAREEKALRKRLARVLARREKLRESIAVAEAEALALRRALAERGIYVDASDINES
jgi:hypothetical protein